MGSPRMKGNALSMLVGDPPTNYWADLTKCAMENDFQSSTTIDGIHQSIPGPDGYWFEVEAIQSTDPDSFWTFVWEHPDAMLPFAYAPHGNAEPTPSQPHFTGILQLPGPPRLGGEASEDITYVFEARLPIIQGPLRVTE